MKSAPLVLALLAGAIAAPASADNPIQRLNNQVYLGVAAEPTTYNGKQTLLAEDAQYEALEYNVDGSSNRIRNLQVGARFQPRPTGLSMDVLGRRSEGTLKSSRALSGLEDPLPAVHYQQDWSRDEVLGNIGWAFVHDGGGMQATPFITVGSLQQRQFVDGGIQGSSEQRQKSNFIGVGLRHQTSISASLALELEGAYERHSFSWEQVSLDVFGQPTGAGGNVDVKRADGWRVAVGLSQQVWKNVRANYGIRHNGLSVSGSFADMPVLLRQSVTSLSLGLGVSF